jgi:hypothetical protein
MNVSNLDPRIGYLNSGRFYAYVGAARKEVMGSREEVEIALGLRKKARPAIRTFIVTVKPGVESWNCKTEEVPVDARSHADAIKQVRADYNENTAWTNGAATYRVRLA